jgi:flavin reductase (DIM6/NTAB) family NADH-FMN oxidoreductase RutF
MAILHMLILSDRKFHYSLPGRRGAITMKKFFGAKTLVFPTSVWVVGTYDGEGKPNVMSAA